jgi:hypothetical protein
VGEVAFHQRAHLVHGHVAADLGRQRRDFGVVDATGDDAPEPAEVGIAVQREAVHRRAPRDPDADRRDLAFGTAVVGWQPHTGAPGDLDGVHTELGADGDERLFEPANVADRVDRHGQPHDRVADQLAGPVPGDAAAAIDLDDRRAVDRALEVLGAPAGRVDRRMLKQQAGVTDLARNALGVHLTLHLPRVVIRQQPEMLERETIHTLDNTAWRSPAWPAGSRCGDNLPLQDTQPYAGPVNTGTVVLILALVAPLSGLVGMAIGSERGRGTLGFWLGFFLGAIGWILVAVMQATPEAEVARANRVAAVMEARSGGARQCPWCAESIKPAAVVCRFCGRDVEPLPAPVEPEAAPARRQSFDFLAQEHPSVFDAVWDAAAGIEPWPRLPTPALRAACKAVEQGTPPAEAVHVAFAAAFAAAR